MAKIIITNLENRLISFNGEVCSILEGLQENGQDWMHACGGKGRCTTCAFTIVSLDGRLSELSEAEERFMTLGRLGKMHRLACQTKLSGTLTLRVPEANKLPHLTYNQ